MLRTLLPALAFFVLALSAAPAVAQGNARGSVVTDKVLLRYLADIRLRFADAAKGLPFTKAETFSRPQSANLSLNIFPSGKVVVVGLTVSNRNLRRALIARFSSLVVRPPPPGYGNPLKVGLPIVFD